MVPKPRADRKVRASLYGVGEEVRFFERTKTRAGTVGKLGSGKLYKWRIRSANGALLGDGTEHVLLFNGDQHCS